MEIESYHNFTLGTKDPTLIEINRVLYKCMNLPEFIHAEIDTEVTGLARHFYNEPRIKELRVCTKKEYLAGAGKDHPLNLVPPFNYKFVAVCRIKLTSKMPEHVGDDTVYALGYGTNPKNAVLFAISEINSNIHHSPTVSKKKAEEISDFVCDLRKVVIEDRPKAQESRGIVFPKGWK